MKYTKTQRARAARLLASSAWQGDHEFTGDALVAWMTMKDRYLKFLIAIVAGKNPRVPYARCPVAVSWDSTSANYIQRGTSAGDRWAYRVRTIWQ